MVFRLILLGWISIACIRFSWAERLPSPPHAEASIAGSNAITSVLESIADLPSQEDLQHSVTFTLADGTQIGGLLFVDSTKGVRPLVIADYGLMSSRDSGLGGEFIENILTPGLINANFLVVDDITGADFYVLNKTLSLGGYDAGRILVELGAQIKAQGIPFSSLHLMGESLGGLAVLQALIEDKRLGTHEFQSAITFSAVLNEAQSTASVISFFGYNLSGIVGPSVGIEGSALLLANMLSFNNGVTSDGSDLPTVSYDTAGTYFDDEFRQRLEQPAPPNWNPFISRVSVEDYIETSSNWTSQIGQGTAPVIVVHAQNDPLVPFAQFQSFAQAENSNSSVYTFGTGDGGHCGFIGTYGASWVASLVNRALGLSS